MISPSRISLPSSFGVDPAALVDELLESQRSLTAIERFSALHDAAAVPAQGLYAELLPLQAPGPGEQYAFEVDLDRCTGCKACVTACHNLNGLDEDETWRAVGLLQPVPESGNAAAPAQQHVTTACHHCLEPGCAQGCPTRAYEKDPVTGVVRHLDDQCFGCQYCILKCPYDVPQYHADKGIVRKCDLCVGRLRAGEAPACAQACPTGAIRVTVVSTAAIARAPEVSFDLPGAPDPSRVKPTTRYRSSRPLDGLVPADASVARVEHAHVPLVLMLVASQAAAGYWILWALQAFAQAVGPSGVSGPSAFMIPLPGFLPVPASSVALPLPELFGVLGVQTALALSLFHLGRPWLAWKAVLGWRTSWLSREVLAFTALAATTGAALALPVAASLAGIELPAAATLPVAGGVLVASLAAVGASAMVYIDTPRALWATPATLARFLLTAVLAGVPAWLLVAGGPGVLWPAWILPPAILVKLALEVQPLRHRRADGTALWKAARLLDGTLRGVWTARLLLGLSGAFAFPLLLSVVPDGLVPAWIAALFVLVLAGELLERALFFMTAAPPRMPGARR